MLNPGYVHFSSRSSRLTFACCSATKNTLPASLRLLSGMTWNAGLL